MKTKSDGTIVVLSAIICLSIIFTAYLYVPSVVTLKGVDVISRLWL